MDQEIVDQRIGGAAYATFEVQHDTPLKGDFNVDLGATFTDAAVREGYAKRPTAETIRHYRLHDVTLDGSTMMLLRGRSRIVETRHLVPDDAYDYMLVKPLHPILMDRAEHFVLGCTRAWHNYYHWLIQAVPAIDAAMRHSNHRRITLVLPPSLLPWQEESLALLGFQSLPRLLVDISGHYELPSVEFSEFLSDRAPGLVSPAAMATFQRLSQAVPWSASGADEIYVARTDAPNRALENEAELIEMLQGQGVRIIVPGTLSLSEQIVAFRGARLVIGPHGAGMSNIVFCRSGSFIYELVPSHFPGIVFNRLAQAAGHNYSADLFGDAGAGGPHGSTWRVDLDVVATLLAAIRERVNATRRRESAMDFLRNNQSAQPDDSRPPPPAKPTPPMEPPQRVGWFRRMLRRSSRGDS